jgi:hypothetical protein
MPTSRAMASIKRLNFFILVILLLDTPVAGGMAA